MGFVQVKLFELYNLKHHAWSRLLSSVQAEQPEGLYIKEKTKLVIPHIL